MRPEASSVAAQGGATSSVTAAVPTARRFSAWAHAFDLTKRAELTDGYTSAGRCCTGAHPRVTAQCEAHVGSMVST